MIGIPRVLSNSFSRLIEGNINQYSFKTLRDRVNGLTNADWDALRPNNSALTGMEWKRITKILVK